MKLLYHEISNTGKFLVSYAIKSDMVYLQLQSFHWIECGKNINFGSEWTRHLTIAQDVGILHNLDKFWTVYALDLNFA